MTLNLKIITLLLAGLASTSATQQAHAAAQIIGPRTIGPRTIGPRTIGFRTIGPRTIGFKTKGFKTITRHCTREQKLSQDLFVAAYHDNTTEVQRLIWAGAHVNAQNITGQTALHIAANHNHAETAHALIDAGADITIQDNTKRTALNWACLGSHWNTVESLLNAIHQKEAHETFGNLTIFNNEMSGVKLPNEILALITAFAIDASDSAHIDAPQKLTYRWLQEKLGADYAAYRTWKRTQPDYKRFDEKYDGGGPA